MNTVIIFLAIYCSLQLVSLQEEIYALECLIDDILDTKGTKDTDAENGR